MRHRIRSFTSSLCLCLGVREVHTNKINYIARDPFAATQNQQLPQSRLSGFSLSGFASTGIIDDGDSEEKNSELEEEFENFDCKPDAFIEDLRTGFIRLDHFYQKLQRQPKCAKDVGNPLINDWWPFRDELMFYLAALYAEHGFSESKLDAVIGLLTRLSKSDYALTTQSIPSSGKAVSRIVDAVLPPIKDLVRLCSLSVTLACMTNNKGDLFCLSRLRA